jgi:hypothetical protein
MFFDDITYINVKAGNYSGVMTRTAYTKWDVYLIVNK